MAYRIRQIVSSGLEAAGGYNYAAAEVDAAADFAAMTAFQDGSVGFVRGDPDSLYVKLAGTWTKMGKSPLSAGHRLELDGVDPYTLLMANKLFPRRAELEAMDKLTARGDLLTRDATGYARLQKGTAGQVLSQGVSDPAWMKPGDLTISDTNGKYALDTIDGALDEIGLDLVVLNNALTTLPNVHQYIVRWDKVNSQCTRMGDAAAITTTITNFKHSGSANASYDNPFDSLYPWKYRKLVKVNRAAYAALTPGTPITDAVTMWEGEPGFALDGSGDFDGVYTPEFWGRVWEDATYVYAGVADGAVPGWQHFEATIGGRYFGSLDGSNKMTSIANSIAYRGAAPTVIHANAEAQEMTLDDIFTWCADSLLMAVEFATFNSQTAIGKGCSDLYTQGGKVGAAADAAAALLKLPNAFVALCVAGAVIDLGTTEGGLEKGSVIFLSSADLEAEDPLLSTHKAVTVAPIPQAVTTDTWCSLHGYYNDPAAFLLSMSGYNGIDGKCNAYYRGRIAHGNMWRYVLGAYRETLTGHIWVAGSRAEAAAVDALNTGVHRDTGHVLPENVGNYIATMYLDALLPLAPLPKTVGGGDTNPIGDYAYTPPLSHGNTVLWTGGGALDTNACGRFCASWSYDASTGVWLIAALPFLKTP